MTQPKAFRIVTEASAGGVVSEAIGPGGAARAQVDAVVARKAEVVNVAPNGAGYGGGVAIHYDDGFKTDITRVLAIHQELGIPGISQVIPQWIDNGVGVNGQEVMTWADVRELQASGLWSIGNHTLNHLLLTAYDTTVQREMIEGGYARILDELGEPPLWFAPPYHGTDKNVDIMVSRLHARARSAHSAAAAQGGYTLNASTVVPWDAQRYPNGLASLPAFLEDLFYRTVVNGELINIYMHEITDDHIVNGFANVGAAEHRALLEGIRANNIPVLDPRALTYPRMNMLNDSSFEQGGKGWHPDHNKGTAEIKLGQTDAHSGRAYLRLSSTGADDSRANARNTFHSLPVHVTREWRLTYWVRASRATGGTLRTDIRKGTGMSGVATENTTVTANGGNGVAVGGEWTKHSFLVDMTGYNEVRLYFQVRSSDEAAVDVDIDSLSLTPSFAYDINGETVTP